MFAFHYRFSYIYLMSNTQLPVVSSVEIKELKDQYLELIQEGQTESNALTKLNFPRGLYLRLISEDLDFAKQIEDARKLRADHWISKIADSVDSDIEPNEVPIERLKFDKLQFLARVDNPDKYGNNTKKVEVDINLRQFKLVSPEKAKEILAADPFAPIDAEFAEVPEKKTEELL